VAFPSGVTTPFIAVELPVLGAGFPVVATVPFSNGTQSLFVATHGGVQGTRTPFSFATHGGGGERAGFPVVATVPFRVMPFPIRPVLCLGFLAFPSGGPDSWTSVPFCVGVAVVPFSVGGAFVAFPIGLNTLVFPAVPVLLPVDGAIVAGMVPFSMGFVGGAVTPFSSSPLGFWSPGSPLGCGVPVAFGAFPIGLSTPPVFPVLLPVVGAIPTFPNVVVMPFPSNPGVTVR
jgi:hypothetical protein